MAARDFAAAYSIARPLAQKGDRAGATALLCSLLWSVDRAQGGFIGLSDEELLVKCESDKRLDYQAAVASQWSPAPWPTAEVIAFPVAPAAMEIAAQAGGLK